MYRPHTPLISDKRERLTCARVHLSPPVSSLLRSELVVANRLLAGLDEHALHGTPPVVLIGRPHAVNLSLAPNGVAVLLARHAQIDVGAHVLEAHGLVALPVVAVALNGPHVQVVAFAVLSKRADLLWVGGWQEVSQRRSTVLPALRTSLRPTWLLDSGELKWWVWRFRPVFMCVMRMPWPHLMATPRWHGRSGCPRICQ